MTTALYHRNLAELAFIETFVWVANLEATLAIFRNVKYIHSISQRFDGFDR